jgi:preprotein translocase subunit YajC
MLEGMRRGDSVVTIGGLYGTVESVKEGYVIIRADDNTKLKFKKDAVSQIIERKDDAGETKDKE